MKKQPGDNKPCSPTEQDLLNEILKEDPSYKEKIAYLYSSKVDQENTTPIPLSYDLPLNYKFPVDALGKTLSPLVKELHRIIGAPLSICAQSILSSASFVTQSHGNIFIYGRSHPISLFFFTVGKSGERKSAVDQVSLKPIKEYEEEQQRKFEMEMEIYERDQDSAKTAKVKLIKPRDPILLIQEPTYEGLIKSLDQGQPSLGLFSDEGGRFIGGHAMQEDNKLKTITGICELWDGCAISRIRASESAKKLYGKRLSFHLMIQPKISFKIFNDQDLVDQGFLSRCLMSFPSSNMGNRPFVKENIYETQSYKNYAHKINYLLDKPKNYKEGDTQFSLKPKSLIFNDAGINILESFYNEIEKELCVKGIYHDISSFANKAVEHVCRLAGVLTIFSDPDADQISIDTINDAIQIVNFYLKETQRLIGNPELNLMNATQKESNQLAQELLDWMKEKSEKDEKFKNNEFTIRNLLLYAPYKFRNKEVLFKLLSILTDYYWLEKDEKFKKWTLKNIQK